MPCNAIYFQEWPAHRAYAALTACPPFMPRFATIPAGEPDAGKIVVPRGEVFCRFEVEPGKHCDFKVSALNPETCVRLHVSRAHGVETLKEVAGKVTDADHEAYDAYYARIMASHALWLQEQATSPASISAVVDGTLSEDRYPCIEGLTTGEVKVRTGPKLQRTKWGKRIMPEPTTATLEPDLELVSARWTTRFQGKRVTGPDGERIDVALFTVMESTPATFAPASWDGGQIDTITTVLDVDALNTPLSLDEEADGVAALQAFSKASAAIFADTWEMYSTRNGAK